MSNRQGADARRDATSGQIVRFRGPGAAALDQVIEVRTLEGQPASVISLLMRNQECNPMQGSGRDQTTSPDDDHPTMVRAIMAQVPLTRRGWPREWRH